MNVQKPWITFVNSVASYITFALDSRGRLRISWSTNPIFELHLNASGSPESNRKKSFFKIENPGFRQLRYNYVIWRHCFSPPLCRPIIFLLSSFRRTVSKRTFEIACYQGDSVIGNWSAGLSQTISPQGAFLGDLFLLGFLCLMSHVMFYVASKGLVNYLLLIFCRYC